MPNSRGELRETPVDLALESIGKERVGNALWAVWSGDGKIAELNGVVELTRRYVGRGIGPIPVWRTKGEGSCDPHIRLGLILLGDLKGSGLEGLLERGYYHYRIIYAIIWRY